MNYTKLLAEAREGARRDSELYYPREQQETREVRAWRRRRTIQRYLDYISPVPVQEAIDLDE